jgi:hypothetical protein
MSFVLRSPHVSIRRITRKTLEAAETLVHLSTLMQQTWAYMVRHGLLPREQRAPTEIEIKLLRRLYNDIRANEFRIHFVSDVHVNAKRLFYALIRHNIISPDGRSLYVSRVSLAKLLHL